MRKRFIEGFHHDAHPMGILMSTVGALSTFYPDAKDIDDAAEQPVSRSIRLIAKMPTLAAFAFRHRMGQPYVYPDNDLSYTGNFLTMMFKMAELKLKPEPALERALDILFILHADHEQNCSTSAVRSVGSSQVDPYSAVAAGDRRALRPAARRRQRGGAADAAPDRDQGEHPGLHQGREGRQRDGSWASATASTRTTTRAPRSSRRPADDVFEVTGKNPLLEIAIELEKIALEDDYFISRKLYPNVDFYSGLIYEALGMPVEMFPVLFAIGRTSGWIAQWQEMLDDPEQKIARPRQIYTGDRGLDYVPISAARSGRLT